MVHGKRYLIPVFMTVVLLAGCGNNPVSAPDIQRNTPTGQLDPLARIFFTGRDSFGMAFKAKVADAQLEGGPDNFTISSAGHATHLGPIQVAQSLKLDTDSDSIWGTFIFQGQHSQTAAGGYKAAISPEGGADQYALDGVFWIKDHTIKATKAQKDTGWGDLTGTLDRNANTMSYRMDGWLLHFVRGD